MTYYINPHDVLEYLNELGYQNISREQLKEFITDLKKLIKYDQCTKIHQFSEIENIDPHSNFCKPDIFTSLYESSTTASKAKQVPKKEKVISVQIKKPPSKICLKSEESACKSDENLIKSSRDILNRNDDEKLSENSDNYLRQRISSEDLEKNSSKELKPQPKASFIRPRAKVKPHKSDPVALYHQYQAEWKRQKIPGQDNHANLRWIIREKMLGEPNVIPNIPSVSKFKRKQSTRI